MGKLPLLVKAGLLVGTSCGGAVGTVMTPIAGTVAGAIVGALCGLVAGLAMHRTDERERHRGRELDAIIGITKGSMGAPPGSIPPGDLERDPETCLDLDAWASQWITPPPPAARG